ncbi:hypothetical protein [Uliginosibacterium gangwonense]|uniref:hypothetical protein n=1 Tax=Uliginosibacterium gangwonense TaxID=392736 RepID=UPI0003630F0B|nr:hypothetical protein [Uliginosibacterium gangwonense]
MDITPRSTPYGRPSGRQLPFSTRLNSLGDVPLEFRKTVQRLLEGREDQVRHIIYTPEFGTFGEYCPATLLVVTRQEWLAFSAEKASGASICYADFAQTRLIEFSLALLQGRLVLEYGEAGESPCILRFNLTSRDLFLEALGMILGHGVEVRRDELAGRTLPSICDYLSFSMRSTLQESLMPGDTLLDVCAWTRADVASAADRHLLHPGGLALSAQYLFVVTADDPADRTEAAADLSAYNRGVVFLSRRFPVSGRVISHAGLDELVLQVGIEPQASSVNVLLPSSYADAVSSMLKASGQT